MRNRDSVRGVPGGPTGSSRMCWGPVYLPCINATESEFFAPAIRVSPNVHSMVFTIRCAWRQDAQAEVGLDLDQSGDGQATAAYKDDVITRATIGSTANGATAMAGGIKPSSDGPLNAYLHPVFLTEGTAGTSAVVVELWVHEVLK